MAISFDTIEMQRLKEIMMRGKYERQRYKADLYGDFVQSGSGATEVTKAEEPQPNHVLLLLEDL
jgi:hypothetical protein